MKNVKTLTKVILVIIIFGITLIISSQTQAQKREDVVEYLQQRFNILNLPVLEIKILQESPLQLQIVIQSVGDFIKPEDSINLHKVDREVFITAYQNGFYIERYVRILQDSQGNQLYMLDQGATDVQEAITRLSSPSISDEDVESKLNEKIELTLNDFSLQEVITSVNVVSNDGVQTLDLQFSTNSLEDAYKVFGLLHKNFIFPRDSFISEVNTQGSQIVTCTYKINDNKGNTLFFYFYDYQLQRGTWSASDNFKVDLSEGAPPPPLEVVTPIIVSPEETFEETETPTATAKPEETIEATLTSTETITPTP